jgi:uncharacterized OB-fold protein
MELLSAEPQLYDVGAGGEVTLRGLRCSACDLASFPEQHFGCVRCGASGDQLAASPFSGAGVIQSVATVRFYKGSDIAAPFTVAAVVLDEGPLVNGVLTEPDGAKIGVRVAATAITVTRDSGEVAELRFTVTKEGS